MASCRRGSQTDLNPDPWMYSSKIRGTLGQDAGQDKQADSGKN